MVDENQFIAQGELLFTAQTIDKVLINAQFPLDQFRNLARSFSGNEELIKQAFRTGFSSHLFAQLGLSAKVRLADNESPSWQATVERISSSLDPITRTLGIIVSVANPYEQIKPGVKPPLMKGMYTEILLQGKSRDVFLVPRDALHEHEVFISGNENRLERRAIVPVQLQDKMALFATGLNAGEKVIVSDLFPAIPGMILKPVLDERIQQQIADWVEAQ
jgi:multidrug efflux pump subunit AcrA (membrane-fusion protein)